MQVSLIDDDKMIAERVLAAVRLEPMLYGSGVNAVGWRDTPSVLFLNILINTVDTGFLLCH